MTPAPDWCDSPARLTRNLPAELAAYLGANLVGRRYQAGKDVQEGRS